MAKRPKQLPSRPPLTTAQIDAAAYVGSAEHKAFRWWGGLPGAFAGSSGKATRPKKQDTTICPLTREADRDMATEWVREALTTGQMRWYEGAQDFPNHIWYKQENGQLWFGRSVNSVRGQYKGWPIDEEERGAKFG